MMFSKRALAVALALIVPGLGDADGVPRAKQFQQHMAPLSEVEQTTLDPINLEKVHVEDAQRKKHFMAPRFAIPETVSVNTRTNGKWERFPDGTKTWRYVVKYESGCTSLNFGFTKYHLLEGMELFIYDPESDESLGPFTAEDNNIHNELWTGILKSCTAVIELDVDATVASPHVELELGSVGVGYKEFGNRNHHHDGRDLSGSCNNDVVCPEGNAWRDEIQSVAAYSLGGSLFCTGFMVNNARQDRTPYFMTAAHCGVNANNAASLVVFWNFQTSSCGGARDGQTNQFQSGATHLKTHGSTDMTLLLLDNEPRGAYNVAYAGWDNTGRVATSAVAIHHPNVDEKAISFENDPTSTTSYYGNNVPGDGTHIRVRDWDDGTTEPGSSGSPLFDQRGRVIGQLHGGDAACGNNAADWYGKFAVSWNHGLKQYLDPDNTGIQVIDTLSHGTNPEQPPAPFCGDGVVNGSEQCDGSALGGATCASQGFGAGGQLACTSTCTLDTSGCNSPIKVVYHRANTPETLCSIEINYPVDSVKFELMARSSTSGDADLQATYEEMVTYDYFDCGSWNDGNDEECTLDSYGAGTYYVMVYAYEAFTGVNLKVSTEGGGTGSVNVQCAGDCGGQCMSASSSAGCSNCGLCEEFVCDMDSFCCGFQWDQICADLAKDLCS